MYTQKIDRIISNISFLLAVIIAVILPIVFEFIGVSGSWLGKLLNDICVGIFFCFIIPLLLLVNAIYALKPTCAGWWAMLKGLISFAYMAIYTLGATRVLDANFGPKGAILPTLLLHAVTLAVLVFPIIGLIRKRKNTQKNRVG